MSSVLRFHHIRLHEAIVAIAGALFALGVYYALLHVIPKNIQSLIVSVSRTINAVYCCQWVIIAWTISIWVINGQKVLSDGMIILIGLGIFILSAVFAQFYSKMKTARREKNIEEKSMKLSVCPDPANNGFTKLNPTTNREKDMS